MKKMFICSLVGLSSMANAAIECDTPQGQLKLYGDVEFNVDAASSKQQLSSLKETADKKNKPADKDRWDINGRILIGLDGYREINDKNFAGFVVQPLADLSGDMNLDDAAFYFGQKQEWNIKIGRYEAYDMFPLGQDTFIEYSGNTANDLYEDGFGYIYMMKEGRGRSIYVRYYLGKMTVFQLPLQPKPMWLKTLTVIMMITVNFAISQKELDMAQLFHGIAKVIGTLPTKVLKSIPALPIWMLKMKKI